MGKNDLPIIIVGGIVAIVAYLYLTQRQIAGGLEKAAEGVGEVTSTPERWVKEYAGWLEDLTKQYGAAVGAAGAAKERKLQQALKIPMEQARKTPLSGPMAYSFKKLATPGMLEKSIGRSAVRVPAKWQKYQAMLQYGRMKVLQRKIALSSKR